MRFNRRRQRESEAPGGKASRAGRSRGAWEPLPGRDESPMHAGSSDFGFIDSSQRPRTRRVGEEAVEPARPGLPTSRSRDARRQGMKDLCRPVWRRRCERRRDAAHASGTSRGSSAVGGKLVSRRDAPRTATSPLLARVNPQRRKQPSPQVLTAFRLRAFLVGCSKVGGVTRRMSSVACRRRGRRPRPRQALFVNSGEWTQ